VKPPPFTYHAPTSVAEAVELLGGYPETSKVLAGGQSLMPVLNYRLAAPEHIVDINRLPGLGQIERTATGWRVPALVRQRSAELSSELAASAPIVGQALKHVAHPQIRNRGTVCGSLAHADSSAELPSVMLALDARMSLTSARGTRTVAADDFFMFHMTTAMEPDELLIAVEFDDPGPQSYSAFQEFAPRTGDFCLAGAAVTASFSADDVVEQCRIVVAGVAPTPLRLTSVESLVLSSVLDSRALVRAQEAAHRQINPTGDVHADGDYRRQLACVLVRRSLALVKFQKEHRSGG
jgi:CO/xanthine dehydrogenase FAD-binding subunit